jgi:Ca2+-binding EF-hand superfamily protein
MDGCPDLLQSWRRLHLSADKRGISEDAFYTLFDESHVLDNYQREFMLLDRNKDNRLSPKEWEMGESLFQPETRFARLDSDNDGFLNFEEVYGAAQRRPHYGGGAVTSEEIGRHKTEFRHLDSNSDGVLSVEDMDSETFKLLMARADKDGDKMVTLNEYLKSFTMAPLRRRMAATRQQQDKRARVYEYDFDRLDRNGDRMIDRTELMKWPDPSIIPLVHSRRGRINKEEWMAHYDNRSHLLDEWDTGRDGKVSSREFLAAHPAEAYPFQMFAVLDLNGDGQLTYEEIPTDVSNTFKGSAMQRARSQKVTRADIVRLQEMQRVNLRDHHRKDFEYIDENQDGYVNPAEMKKAYIDPGVAVRKADRDRNGVLDMDEFLSLYDRSVDGRGSAARRGGGRSNGGSDAGISFADFRSQRAGQPAGSLRLLFNKIDRNRDGLLQRSEVRQHQIEEGGLHDEP